MPRKKNVYLEDIDTTRLQPVASAVTSWSAFARGLHLLPTGVLLARLRKAAADHNIDTSHFRVIGTLAQPESFLKSKQPWGARRTQYKRALFDQGYLKEECGTCSQGPEFRGEPLPMIVDHIDQDQTNNDLKNLKVLCPNCYYQVQNARMRVLSKKTRKKRRTDTRRDHLDRILKDMKM